MDTICNQMDTNAAKNGGRLPHQYMTKLLADLHACPSTAWISVDTIRSRRDHNTRKCKALVDSAASQEISSTQVATTTTTNISIDDRAKGGRPIGTTATNARRAANQKVRATAIVTLEFAKVRALARKQSRNLLQQSLDRIIAAAKTEVGITDDEIVIGKALKSLKHDLYSKLSLMKTLAKGLFLQPKGDNERLLKRMGLLKPENIKEWIYQKLLLSKLDN